MSYSIIFETKFIKLSDGRLLHLDRSGCNNDNSGRDRSDFTGKIYTKEELDKLINKYIQKEENKDEFELKIGNKRCSYYSDMTEEIMNASGYSWYFLDDKAVSINKTHTFWI